VCAVRPGPLELMIGIPLSARRKVGQIVFNPTAENLLASASGDHVVRSQLPMRGLVHAVRG